MKKLLFALILLSTTVHAGIPIEGNYIGPSEQIIKRDSWEKIEEVLERLEISPALYPFFQEIAAEEDWGHIGYHGAVQDFRIFQDIIRLTLEEVVGIPIRQDFHFLRIPGDKDLNLRDLDAFAKFYGKDQFDNKVGIRAKQLLSLNYGIWSNYDQVGSFSLYLFADNFSKSEIDYSKQLEPFFKEIGLDPEVLNVLFDTGLKRLNGSSGILLKLFERSHLTDLKGEAYNFADNQCYPAIKRGYRIGEELISEEFRKFQSIDYIEGKVEVSAQLRLLINNQNTLNPFSPLCIRRYDLYGSEVIAQYENELREILQRQPKDEVKLEAYRNKLYKLWF